VTLVLPEESACPFCAYLSGESEAVFVSRGPKVSILLNPRQYERGALLVIPNAHVRSLADATDEQFLAVQLEARRMARLLIDHLGATGVNVFQNAGIHAGQTVAHYHVHVVPRYPASEPSKRFREADYAVTPMEQLQGLAAELNAPKNAFLESFDPLFDREYSHNPKAWRAALGIWTVAGLGALWRIVSTAGEASWSSSTAYMVLTLGMLAGGVALATKRRPVLVFGFAASLVLFAVSVMLTF
jgi:diadenosine tetraphosphate (Ap4A) HIT family hydrolase